MCQPWKLNGKKTKRRIPIDHTIEVFGRCLDADQCPGQFLGDEILLCLNELKEIRAKGQP